MGARRGVIARKRQGCTGRRPKTAFVCVSGKIGIGRDG